MNNVNCLPEETIDLGVPNQLLNELDRALVEPKVTFDKSSSELSISANTNSEKTIPDIVDQYYCGCGPVHSKWLQWFAKKKVFTVLMCLYVLLQGAIVSGVTSVIVSSVEKRYAFSSTLAGVMVGMYDVTIVVGIIFISYFGGKTHKPRVLGISLLVLGIGAFVSASPQFVLGSYKKSLKTRLSNEECLPSDKYNTDDCSSTNIAAYIILLLGQVIIGIGSSALYTVGLAYIDEIVYPKFVPLHAGAILVFSVIGPGIGYVFGGLMLTIHVDPWNETDLKPTNPDWVGAWWLPFLVLGTLSILVASLFLIFPKWLPDSHLVRKERAEEMAKIYPQEYANEDNLTIVVKMFPIHIKRVLTNLSFMLTSFALAMIFVIKDGVITFGPKYVESMFHLTASTAGLLAGGVGITAAALGVASGAILVYIWKPKGRQTSIIQLVVVVIAIPFVLVFLVKCPSYNVAGVTVPYADRSISGKDSSVCAMMCNCSSSVFNPVCGSDGITYFSACRAGCKTKLVDDDYYFENCICVAESLSNAVMSSIVNDSNSTAVDGSCSTSCSQLFVFMILISFLVFLMLMIEIPYIYYTLRVVADDQRHLALGVQSAISRVFGSIPGPLLFGVVVDLACVEWEYNCGVRGNCWIYDNDKLSFNGMVLTLPFALLSSILLLLATIVYPKKTELAETRRANET